MFPRSADLWYDAGKEVPMNDTIEVSIPVDAEAAAALSDARNRRAVGKLISRVLHPTSGASPLARAIADLQAEVKAAGLTDADIDAELAAFNAECRDRRPAD